MTGKMDDKERQLLAEKLDAELDEFIAQKEAEKAEMDKNKPEEPAQSLDELVEELKNHPAFMTEFDPSKPMSAAMEGLQALKYETDSAEDNADGYKDDGNNNFKMKKYRWAIDNYTAGIKCLCKNRELNAILYSNRAAAHFYISNFRSSYNDSVIALKFKPDHMKALLRAAQCSTRMRKYDQAIKWCDEGLQINPKEAKLLEMRASGDKLKREAERENRKDLAKERKELQEKLKVLEEIFSRGINVAGFKKKPSIKDVNPKVLDSVECHHPSGAKVHLDNKGVLHWPVYFVYPEFGESDFIAAFNENSTFNHHLESIFGIGTEAAPWDEDEKYKPGSIEIYFENQDQQELHHVKKNNSLLEVLQHEMFFVYGGTPGFILLVPESPFGKNFLDRYNMQ